MKTPIDIVKGKIVDIDPYGTVTIEAKYTDMFTFIKRNYQECYIQMIDSKPLSEKQRKACYALIKEISNYTGMGLNPAKEYLKIKFLAEDLQETADKIFSLSNAPMSLVCAFQRYLVNFIVSWDIPCSFPLLDYVDDIDDYIYACMVNKKCCICGKKAYLHHWERVGMGRDREEINHVGMLAEPLCGVHHTECHTMAQEEFDRKHHIKPIKIDKTIAKVYDLHQKEEKNA